MCVEMLEVSVKKSLTDFCFCLAGPPTVSSHTTGQRRQKKAQNTRAHLVIDRLGLEVWEAGEKLCWFDLIGVKTYNRLSESDW